MKTIKKTVLKELAAVFAAIMILMGFSSCITTDGAFPGSTGSKAKIWLEREDNSENNDSDGLKDNIGPSNIRRNGDTSQGGLPTTRDRGLQSASLSTIQNQLIHAAEKLVGTNDLRIRDKAYNFDCTGVVLATYYEANMDLQAAFPNYEGNGVKRLYDMLKDRHLLHQNKFPAPGDIIFWDNTYDANGNGQWDDYLSHTGMVVSVDESGNITYLHHDYIHGIVYAQMNLLKPDTFRQEIDGEMTVVNSPMRMQGHGREHGWLSGQLFRGFGSAHKL